MYKRTENNILGQSGIETKKRVEVEGRVRHKRGSDSVRKCTLGRGHSSGSLSVRLSEGFA